MISVFQDKCDKISVIRFDIYGYTYKYDYLNNEHFVSIKELQLVISYTTENIYVIIPMTFRYY